MKKLISLFLLAALLCGCAGNAAPSEPETTLPEATETQTQPAQTEEAKEAYVFSFSAEDRQGNLWTQEQFGDYSVIMMNFWEPWCGPCVGEMPDLEKLYEAYADQGFLILGVYSTLEPDEDIVSVLEDAGITYPILKYSEDFNMLQTGYVPTTVFFDSQGHILNQPFAGSMSYDDWAEIVELLL